jgi:hypothetical protein
MQLAEENRDADLALNASGLERRNRGFVDK